MAIRPVIEDPDPRLREVSAAVRDFDDAFRQRLQDVVDTFRDNQWIGLSAPQIGILERIVVMDLSDSRDALRVLINPEIVSARGFALVEESCASVPGVTGTVLRSTQVHVAAQDERGEPIEAQLSNMEAVCLQHELDHLDGKLFIDRLPFWRRWRLRRQAARA